MLRRILMIGLLALIGGQPSGAAWLPRVRKSETRQERESKTRLKRDQEAFTSSLRALERAESSGRRDEISRARQVLEQRRADLQRSRDQALRERTRTD